MYTENLNEWFKLNNQFTHLPLLNWNKKASELCQHLAEEQMELLSNNLSKVSEQIKRSQHVKMPQEMLELQKECLCENMNLLLQNSQKLTRLGIEGFEECMKLFTPDICNASSNPSPASPKKAEREKESKL